MFSDVSFLFVPKKFYVSNELRVNPARLQTLDLGALLNPYYKHTAPSLKAAEYTNAHNSNLDSHNDHHETLQKTTGLLHKDRSKILTSTSNEQQQFNVASGK